VSLASAAAAAACWLRRCFSLSLSSCRRLCSRVNLQAGPVTACQKETSWVVAVKESEIWSKDVGPSGSVEVAIVWWNCLCECWEGGRRRGVVSGCQLCRRKGLRARMTKAHVVAWPTSSPKT